MIRTNRHEVYMIVLNAADDGVATSAIARLLGVPAKLALQHLWRLAKAGSVINLTPHGGNEEGLWVAVADPYGGARDVSDVEQRWLQPGQYRIEIPTAPASVWQLAR